ncbi:MAG: hypothetical protein ACAH11_04760 [Sphingomonas sp.]
MLAYLVLLGLFLILYGLLSLLRPEAMTAFELRQLKRYPGISWPFSPEAHERYLRSARHRVTTYAVGAGATLFGGAFLWAAGRMRGLW